MTTTTPTFEGLGSSELPHLVLPRTAICGSILGEIKSGIGEEVREQEVMESEERPEDGRTVAWAAW